MSADPKPLFRPDAVRPGLVGFHLPPAAGTGRAKLAAWAGLLASKAGGAKKETELRDEFLYDVFRDVLGYTTPTQAPHGYTFKKEAAVRADGTFADAAFGRFNGEPARFTAVMEGKGPGDPLERPYGGRKLSAVQQALQYAVQLRIDWYLVTNLRETRLYHKGHDTLTYERFETAKLAADDAQFARFVYLLGAERVVPPNGLNHLDALLSESKKIGRELTNEFYAEYRGLRERTFAALRQYNPTHEPAALLTATQKMLDRVLFVAFCEDRGLMPPDIIEAAYRHTNQFTKQPVWTNFVGLFRSVDEGNDALNIARYNGGLFAPDPFLDGLTVPDAVCEGFRKLAEYEYGNDPAADAKLIDVEILGHIFEQSITDLEELHRAIAAGPDAAGPSKRKKEGAFYTPEYITRYIVAETLGPVLRDRFETLRTRHSAKARGRVKSALEAPREYDAAKLTDGPRKALVAFWQAWLDELERVRVVDPSCGSGAFLIEAFDQMFAEYQKAEGFLRDLGAGSGLFEPKRTILTKNLFGVDLNGEAIEIARLSCWIKTAELGKVLTTLDRNIVQGNSIVADRAFDPLALDWNAVFPAAFADGGFDAVIGNPPYVRQEWISPVKPYLQTHYKAFDGTADLYVYFYELGLNLLKPGGRLGFIVTNKWLKAGYGEKLRALYAESAWVESVVDLGHNKEVFPDADVFPCILVARKPSADPVPPDVLVCAIPREQFRVDDLSRQIHADGFAVPRSRFGSAAWSLEPPGVNDLMDKIRAAGMPLREWIKAVPCRGILTGFNDAFLIDTPTKERLVAADPQSEALIRPYLRGQDLDRWQAEWAGLWMIAMKSSGNHPWPWAGKPDAEAEAAFRATYPALFDHFAQYRMQLTNRQDQGEYWWELRACAYWDKFDRPKIMYQDITWNQRFGLDTARTLSNNTVYFLPTADPWSLSVLNAPVSWWFAWRTAQHGKDEALRLFTEYLNAFPIPTPTDEALAAVTASVERLRAIAQEQQSGRRTVLDWLRVEYGIVKPSQKLSALIGLSADEFAAEVRKLRGRAAPLSVAGVKRLMDEHAASVVPLQSLGREALGLERRVSDAVNAAYRLTPDDVKLLWATAPPRMPIPAPTG